MIINIICSSSRWAFILPSYYLIASSSAALPPAHILARGRHLGEFARQSRPPVKGRPQCHEQCKRIQFVDEFRRKDRPHEEVIPKERGHDQIHCQRQAQQHGLHPQQIDRDCVVQWIELIWG